MTKYAVRFDFPEAPEIPWFAGLVNHAFGLTTDLDEAVKYELASDAERVLKNAYGPSMRKIGTVVVVGQ